MRTILVVVAFLVVFGAVGTYVIEGNDPSFVSNFMANFAGTIMGAAVGVPVALWVNDVGREREQRRSKDAAAAEAASRKELVLRMIRTELEWNLIHLVQCKAAGRGREINIPFASTDAWDAVSDSGDLHWLNDPELLDKIAKAYTYVQTVRSLEEDWFHIINYPGMVGDPSKGEKLQGYLAFMDEELERYGRIAIDAIKAVLKK